MKENTTQKVLSITGILLLILSPIFTYFFSVPLTRYYCDSQIPHIAFCGLVRVYIIGGTLFIGTAFIGCCLIYLASIRRKTK
jgi:hypothetical protein